MTTKSASAIANLIADKAINAIQISVNKLAEILKATTKSTVCNIIYFVDCSNSRTINGKKAVQKLVQITHCYLNHSYTNKVINLTGNTDFVAQEMKGKSRVCSTLIQSDKTGELMIDGKVLKVEAATILGYFHEGKLISEAQGIAADLWTPAYYNPAPTFTKGRGTVEVEDDFAIINTYLSRIKAIKLGGQWYYMESE